ncbi:YbhN family protein [Candidatus Poribacteria bacterium]
MRIGEKEYRIKTGLTIFLALSTVSAMAIFYIGADKDTWTSLKHVRPGYGLLAGVFVIVYWALNGLKFQILLKGLGADVSFWDSFRAFVANLFLGAVTPFQTGGGPLQIYILNRAGVPLAIAFSGCLVGAMLTILSLVSSTLVILLFKSNLGLEFGQLMSAIFSVVSLIFLLALALFILSLFKMEILKWVIGRGLNFLTRGKTSLTERVMGGLDQYSECMSIYAKTQKRTLVAAGVLTLISMAVFSSVACLILAGLNCPQVVPRVFLTQFVLNFIVYFSPTPGGSGVAEFCNYLIMTSITGGQNMMEIYTLVWRFFTNFIGVGLGGLIVLTLFRKERRKESAEFRS